LTLGISNEYFKLFVDGASIKNYGPYIYTSGTNLCGRSDQTGWKEQVFYFDESVTHSTVEATVKFSANLDSVPYDESWGLYSVQLVQNGCRVCDIDAAFDASLCTCPVSQGGALQLVMDDVFTSGTAGWSSSNLATTTCGGYGTRHLRWL